MQAAPVLPLTHIGQILWIGQRPTFANLNPPVSFIDGAMIAMRHLLKVLGQTPCEQVFHIGVQSALILFERQNIVRFLCLNLRRDVGLTIEGVQRYDATS